MLILEQVDRIQRTVSMVVHGGTSRYRLEPMPPVFAPANQMCTRTSELVCQVSGRELIRQSGTITIDLTGADASTMCVQVSAMAERYELK